MSLIIRNIIGSVIEISDLGITLEIGEDYQLTDEPSQDIASSVSLVNAVNSNFIIALDPLDNFTPLTKPQSIMAIQSANDTHFRIKGGELDQLDDVDLTGITNGYVLTYDVDTWKPLPSGGAGSGEANTASNLGTGEGWYAQKVGADLQFKSIKAGTGITLTPSATEIEVTNSDPNVDQNLFETFDADTGTTTADTITDTLTVSGGTGISTSITGDTLTVTNDAPNVDQNLFETVTADTGSTTAATTTATLNIVGGSKITTLIVGNTLTIDWGNFSITDIPGGFTDNDVIQFNSNTDLWEVVQLDHSTLTGIGTNSHTQIDSHIVDVVNPHMTRVDNLNDVVLTTPNDGDILVYHPGTDTWDNHPLVIGGSGRLIQVQFGPIPALASTVSIPIGLTAPLITDGVEIWSQSLTPQFVDSDIRLQTSFSFDIASNNTELVVAFFRDSICIGTAIATGTTKKFNTQFSTTMYDAPLTTSPVVYSCRVGKNTGTTFYINRTQQSVAALGGTLESQAYTVEEIGVSA